MIRAATILIVAFSVCAVAFAQPAAGPIRLIVRGDDMGVCHAGNVACITAYKQGIVRSVEVIVPGQWFPEAVKLLNENPGLDVGVHLCLTSEWQLTRWRPLTYGPSLTDAEGFFFASNSGFLQAHPRPDDIERELRAQIETARRQIKNVTHLSVHMNTAGLTPQLAALTQRLAEEYRLPVNLPGVSYAKPFGGPKTTSQDKEANLVKILQELPAGAWLMVEHPGLDVAEMQAMGHPGYENVAADRQGVTDAFTSAKVKEVVTRRGIRVMSYADVIR